MESIKKMVLWVWYKLNVWAMLGVAGLYYGKLMMYKASNRINTDFHTINMAIDDMIPFCKYFVFFYFTYYWFSQLQLWIVSLFDKRKFWRMLIGAFVTCFVCNLVFLTYQVKMIRPELIGDDFFMNWCKWVYRHDPKALNCFPSIHAVMGVYMIIGAWKTGKMPKWLSAISIIFGLGCIVSTVFVKQHYFIDMVAGVIVAIAIYALVVYIDKKLQVKEEIMRTKIAYSK